MYLVSRKQVTNDIRKDENEREAAFRVVAAFSQSGSARDRSRFIEASCPSKRLIWWMSFVLLSCIGKVYHTPGGMQAVVKTKAGACGPRSSPLYTHYFTTLAITFTRPGVITAGITSLAVGFFTNPASFFAAASFISSVISRTPRSRAPRKSPGNTSELLT